MKKEQPESFFKATARKVGELVQGAKENSKVRAREAQLKKYNPLFPEQYRAETFKLPNVIVIVDDAVRKGIEVCEGAIGWLSDEKGVEVLHLYDEYVEESGLKFVPAPICDVAYCVDQHDRSVFISVDTYFSRIQEEKLAELQHIAYCVGAKRYSVEMVEEQKKTQMLSFKVNVKVKDVEVKANEEREENKSEFWQGKALAYAEFQEQRQAVRPMLLWFADDKNVLNLVEMCCSGQSIMKNYTLELQNTLTMSYSAMQKIKDAVSNMNLNSLKIDIKKEYSKKMIFKLEF